MSNVNQLPEPLARCPFCAASYTDANLRIIRNDFGQNTTHALCSQCLRAMLFAVERRGHLLACVGVLTDCDANEAVRFGGGFKISLDEVLEAHQELRK